MNTPLARPGRVRQVVVLAALTQASGNLPMFLVGSLVVLMRTDIPFTEGQLGLAVSIFFATAVLASVPSGRLVERIGPSHGFIVGTMAVGGSMGAIAVVAQSTWHVYVALILGGVGTAVVQPSTNTALAFAVPRARLGIAFGIKQASVPGATLVAGAVVPVIGVTAGWRWAFGMLALAMLPLAMAARTWVVEVPVATPRTRGDRRGSGPGRLPLSILLFLALGAALGTATASVMSAFYVDYVVRTGVEPATAGVWLSVGGVAGIAGRLSLGFAADRLRVSTTVIIPVVMVLGAFGFVLLGMATTAPVLATATVLCFALGWGWNGLFHMMTVQLNHRSPAAATGITTAGMRTGGVVGPSAFGWAVQRWSYPLGWTLAATTLVVAALLLSIGGRLATRHQAAADVPPW